MNFLFGFSTLVWYFSVFCTLIYLSRIRQCWDQKRQNTYSTGNCNPKAIWKPKWKLTVTSWHFFPLKGCWWHEMVFTSVKYQWSRKWFPGRAFCVWQLLKGDVTRDGMGTLEYWTSMAYGFKWRWCFWVPILYQQLELTVARSLAVPARAAGTDALISFYHSTNQPPPPSAKQGRTPITDRTLVFGLRINIYFFMYRVYSVVDYVAFTVLLITCGRKVCKQK